MRHRGIVTEEILALPATHRVLGNDSWRWWYLKKLSGIMELTWVLMIDKFENKFTFLNLCHLAHATILLEYQLCYHMCHAEVKLNIYVYLSVKIK